ncbi:MAG: hypothetical protein JST00_40250 [Deltaproteobacteria bacterium]|nr:hypothetical protein [Deltaproteobacteria bacterium]
MTRSASRAGLAAVLLPLFCGTACSQAGSEAAPSSAPLSPPPGLAGQAAGGDGTPTWYRDVEPIVQVHCVGCHTATGAGAFPMDRETTTSIADFVAATVLDGKMPPWPVGPASARIVDARGLEPRDVRTIVDWAAAGAPLGDPRDHVDRAPRARPLPARSPDIVLGTEEAKPYVEPSSPFVTDEVRCFVMDTPPRLAGARVTAARFLAGAPLGVHDMGAIVVDAATATMLRTRGGVDGRAGFECGGGLGDAEGVLLGGHDTGSGPPAATILPAQTSVAIPEGGAIVLRVHYGVKHLAGAVDRPSVALWLASPEEAATLRALLPITIEAPVEIPCPTGVSTDPSSPCSRDAAFARFAAVLPADARARADARLARCGARLDAMTNALAFSPGGAARFLVPTTCREPAPFDGTIRVVRAQLHTYGASVRVEAEQPDGAWEVVLDIPRWRWGWAGAYVLEKGVAIHAGRGLRISCTFDNGLANQWSALTGEPGHGGPSRSPWVAPSYLIAAPHRAAERCAVDLAVDRR